MDSGRARRCLLALLLALPLALPLACTSSRRQPDAAAEALDPEQRFGNDPVIVAGFRALSKCAHEGGRVDRSCSELKRLQRKMATRLGGRDRKKLRTTLVNLLESRRELTRLVAADSLYPLRRDPAVAAALSRALKRERSAPVKAALLRQLCWSPGPQPRRAALGLLAPATPEVLRTQAVACLARGGGAADGQVAAALRKVLQKDPSPALRGAACAALGQLGSQQAVADLAAGVGRGPQQGSLCAAALAAVGSAGAYRALVRAIEAALAAGSLPAQAADALASFEGQAFFDRQAVLALLERMARSGATADARARARRAAEALETSSKEAPAEKKGGPATVRGKPAR
jgi:hypothetical protein